MTEYEHYKTQYGDLYDAQLLLEDEAKRNAEERMKIILETVRRNGEAGSSKLASCLMEHAWETSRTNISTLIKNAQTPKKTTQGNWVEPMKELVSIYGARITELEDMLILIGHSTAIDCVLLAHKTQQQTLSNVAICIGRSIMREASVERFFQWSQETKDLDKRKLQHSMDKGIAQRVRNSYRIVYAVNRMHKAGFTGLKWDKQAELALGAKILEMLVAGSAYYEIVDRHLDNKKIKCLAMTEWFEKAWFANEDKTIANAIKYIPTIIPPKPWTTPQSGGYYGASTLGVKLIRMEGAAKNPSINAYVNKLNAVNLDPIYSVLNAMQQTPFVINHAILDVLKSIYASGGELGGIPRTEPIPQLPNLPEGRPEEELKEHKRKMVAIYKQEEARKTKALRCHIALKTAERFAEYERIYFPWNIDYRGRCYPIPTAISPQGDDIQKALLLFADPSPLAAEEDTKWLAIHGANLAGRDKLPFGERVKWIEDNKDNILASAADPLSFTWWSDVAKNDYPMEFLAFCLEWKRLLDYKAQHDTAVGFVSSLPVAFDGTCSGLQHFSGLLRDEIGGAAVNLLPSDSVQDIYNIVADKVNVTLLQDAKSGTEDGWKTNKDGEIVTDAEGKPRKAYGTKTLAQNWICFNRLKYSQDGITRKVCKRSVMTLAYGSKQYGFRENLLSDIINPFVLDHPDDNPFISPQQAAGYMAKLIWDAVGATVVKAVEGMAWLQKVAELICQDNHVVTWTTPNGLPVQQNYMVMIQEVVQLRFNKARVRFYTQTEQEGLVDIRKQAQGIAPNFIHSMDAAHLQRVVNSEFAKDNRNFMMIHDSFGTDAAHAGQLFKTIREEFVNLYRDQNHLETFLHQVSYLISDRDMDKIPNLPSFGKLDLEEVKKSNYCFA